jgi:hypothetical protein
MLQAKDEQQVRKGVTEEHRKKQGRKSFQKTEIDGG